MRRCSPTKAIKHLINECIVEGRSNEGAAFRVKKAEAAAALECY